MNASLLHDRYAEPASKNGPPGLPQTCHSTVVSKREYNGRYKRNIQAIKEKMTPNKIRRELDEAQQKGRLLIADLDAAQMELEAFRDKIEKQRARQKEQIENLMSSLAIRKTPMFPMGSLLGGEERANVDKYKDCHTVGKYNVGAFLGKGTFGRVFYGTHSETKKEYAIKVFDKDTIRTKRQLIEIEHEVAVMKHAKHPNVLRLHELIVSSHHICMVTELGHLDLYNWTQENDTNPRVYREIIIGLVKAVRHLHAIGIAHLDIKEDNILVMKNVSANELTQKHIKLCDFGLSTISSSGDGCVEESSVVGTKGYFAPEMTSDYDYDARAADMWSVGCTILHLVDKVPEDWREIYGLAKTRKDSFQKRMRVLALTLHCEDDYFQGTISPVVQIIRGLLKIEPNNRLTAAEVLQHRWLAE